MSLAEKAKRLANARPELIVDLKIYPTAQGGRVSPIEPGWGSPCTVQSERGSGWIGYDGWPLLDKPMVPGEARRVGYVFLSGKEAADHLRSAGKFYILEGGIIGEAAIVDGKNSD